MVCSQISHFILLFIFFAFSSSPEHATDGISTNQKGLFIALTEAGFADGNNSYRSPCPTGTFFPHLDNFLYSTALEAECISCPPGKYFCPVRAFVRLPWKH